MEDVKGSLFFQDLRKKISTNKTEDHLKVYYERLTRIELSNRGWLEKHSKSKSRSKNDINDRIVKD